MTAVKGSKQYRMKVVPYRPWMVALIMVSLVVALVAAVVGSFYYGKFSAGALQTEAVAEYKQLRRELEQKSTEAEQLRQQVANLSLGSQVDRKASEDVRAQVIELKNKVAEQQEVISLYKGLMSPTATNNRGLSIGSLEIIATGVGRSYQYKLVVQQLATNRGLLTGSLKFNIVGRKDNEPVVLSLKAVAADVDDENIKLRFKYFQTIEGTLVLPEGFEPQRVELQVTSNGSDSVVVEKKFGWQVQGK